MRQTVGDGGAVTVRRKSTREGGRQSAEERSDGRWRKWKGWREVEVIGDSGSWQLAVVVVVVVVAVVVAASKINITTATTTTMTAVFNSNSLPPPPSLRANVLSTLLHAAAGRPIRLVNKVGTDPIGCRPI